MEDAHKRIHSRLEFRLLLRHAAVAPGKNGEQAHYQKHHHPKCYPSHLEYPPVTRQWNGSQVFRRARTQNAPYIYVYAAVVKKSVHSNGPQFCRAISSTSSYGSPTPLGLPVEQCVES